MSGQDTIIRSQGWEFCRTDNDKYHNDYNTVYGKCYWGSAMHEQQNHHSWIKTELAKWKLQLFHFCHGLRPAFLIHKLNASIVNGGEASTLGKKGGEWKLTWPLLKKSQGNLCEHKSLLKSGMFILSANLTASRITMETNHWACLGGSF